VKSAPIASITFTLVIIRTVIVEGAVGAQTGSQGSGNRAPLDEGTPLGNMGHAMPNDVAP
jgi:hypothetical protein